MKYRRVARICHESLLTGYTIQLIRKQVGAGFQPVFLLCCIKLKHIINVNLNMGYRHKNAVILTIQNE